MGSPLIVRLSGVFTSSLVPNAPVVAYLLEHNYASARVAVKMNMSLFP